MPGPPAERARRALGLLALVLLALALRGWRLGRPPLWADEAESALKRGGKDLTPARRRELNLPGARRALLGIVDPCEASGYEVRHLNQHFFPTRSEVEGLAKKQILLPLMNIVTESLHVRLATNTIRGDAHGLAPRVEGFE